MKTGNHWNDLTAQQLVRYEALFELLGVLQADDNLQRIANEVAQRWKYFANVASWRLQLSNGLSGYLLIDGIRGEGRVTETAQLPDWEAYHCHAQRPCRVRPEAFGNLPAPPEHLAGRGISEIEVIPFSRGGECHGILSVAARHVALTELDNRFIRTFGSYLTDRISDIVLRREATAALLDRATRDALTRLPNRATILERLSSQFAHARRSGEALAVIIADIDHFKRINDTHGHQAGDLALQVVAQRLQDTTRDGESVGRYGGEEFLFVLYPCSRAQAAHVAERMRLAVAEKAVELPDETAALPLTISLGFASTCGHADERIEQLLGRADAALYRAKAEGRNRASAAD
jgi:diguanylate cyclase (GGDEF)-like protein